MGKYDKVNKCPEEFIGRIIDIMEDYISKKNQDSSDDTPNTVHIQGDDYTYLSDALKDTLEKWGVLGKNAEPKQTNAEMLADALRCISDDEIAESVEGYIECPDSEKWGYRGAGNYAPCVACKSKWLKSQYDK